MDLRKIDVLFKQGTKKYTYYTTLQDLKWGDLLIAPIGDEYQVVKYVGTHKDQNIPCRCIVQKVNVLECSNLMAMLDRKNKIRQLMEKRRKELEETVMWQVLAEKDEDIKILLQEYNAI